MSTKKRVEPINRIPGPGLPVVRSTGLLVQNWLMSPPSNAIRVLVVDDHVDCAESLAQLLFVAGYDVQTAQRGLQAIETAESWHPGVVLLDIGLPDLDGHEVGRRLRATEWGSRALLIAVSGWDADQPPGQPGSAGFDHRMVKPIDVDALVRLLPAPTASADRLARAA